MVWRYIANGIIANAMPCSRNRNLKCNRICKLPASSSCLGTFYDPYSSFLNYQFLTLSSDSSMAKLVKAQY